MNRVVMMMAAAGSGLFCALPAQAAVVASAGLGAVEIQLVDLDPNDGIAPWLVVDAAASRIFSLFSEASEATQSQPVASTSQSLDGAASWPARGVVASVAWAQASASIAGSSEGLSAALSLAGSTADFVSPSNADQASFSARAEDSGALFTLSPHTRVEFRLPGSVTFRTTAGADAAYAGDFSFAAIGIRIAEAEGGTLVMDSESFPCSPFVDQSPCVNPNFQGYLQVAYDNTGSANFSGRLSPVVELAGSSHANALPVPEPAPLALWALGAGTLAWWARRRSRSA